MTECTVMVREIGNIREYWCKCTCSQISSNEDGKKQGSKVKYKGYSTSPSNQNAGKKLRLLVFSIWLINFGLLITKENNKKCSSLVFFVFFKLLQDIFSIHFLISAEIIFLLFSERKLRFLFTVYSIRISCFKNYNHKHFIHNSR